MIRCLGRASCALFLFFAAMATVVLPMVGMPLLHVSCGGTLPLFVGHREGHSVGVQENRKAAYS